LLVKRSPFAPAPVRARNRGKKNKWRKFIQRLNYELALESWTNTTFVLTVFLEVKWSQIFSDDLLF
jgi:hypothetical protein